MSWSACGPQAQRCSCECERKETPYRREGKSWAGSEIFARSGRHADWANFCFYKTCRGNLPRLAFYGMRSQYKFVITAGLALSLVCHRTASDKPGARRPERAKSCCLGGTKHANAYTHASRTAQNATRKGPNRKLPFRHHFSACGAAACASVLRLKLKGTASAAAQSNKKVRVPISEEHPVIIDARECEQAGKVYTLRGDVQIQFAEYIFHGDLVTYDSASGDVTAKGHVSLDGGRRDIHISGSEGSYNLHSQTGKFYDVRGSTGARFKGRSVTLTSSSPLSFSGKLVEQTGPDEYLLHNGSVTSCELPRPKWTFTAAKIIMKVGSSAHVYNATFRLKGVPVFYLPYASPPVERLGVRAAS